MKTFSEMNEVNSAKLLVVDGINLAFRWKHAGVTDFAEEYCRTVDSLARSYGCGKVVIACDKGKSSYRMELLPTYKGARKAKTENQTAEEEQAFLDFIKGYEEAIEAISSKHLVLRYAGVEADDIAAYITNNRMELDLEHIWLVSSDKDWDLLIDDHVSRFSTVTRKEYTVETWGDHYEWQREEHISIKCLMGDAGDSVPGAVGIGPKKALALLQQYGTATDVALALPIDSKYKHIQSLNSFGAESIFRNYKLMDLVTFCYEAIGKDNCTDIDNKLKRHLCTS